MRLIGGAGGRSRTDTPAEPNFVYGASTSKFKKLYGVDSEATLLQIDFTPLRRSQEQSDEVERATRTRTRFLPLFPTWPAIYVCVSHDEEEGSTMTDRRFLTADEVSERYRGEISLGTLRNWRSMRVGPAFVKIGKAILYPVDQLDAWDEKNLVACRASRRLTLTERDPA